MALEKFDVAYLIRNEIDYLEDLKDLIINAMGDSDRSLVAMNDLNHHCINSLKLKRNIGEEFLKILEQKSQIYEKEFEEL